MNQFAKKITSLTYIYLVLSAPEINAARVKQHYNAARANAGQNSGLSQELLQDMEEAMQEIEQIKSEYLSADMGQASYWGESWASCDDRQADFMRRQEKMEKRYDNAMKDGEMSAMDAGRVSLKAFSVASTLSTASKSGCEWVTNKSIDSSSVKRIMEKTMKEQKCLGPAKEFLEKARAAGEDPEEAKVKAQQILMSVDCKVPTGVGEETQKSFQQLAKMEETAEAGALGEIQEFKKSLDGGKQTSLVETNSGVFFISVLVNFLMLWFFYALVCTVVYTVIATILTMVFLAIKAVFKLALGYTSSGDFMAEMGQIMKPFFTIVATGCAAFHAYFWGVILAIFGGGELALWMGLTGAVGSLVTGGKSLVNQAVASAEEEEEETPVPLKKEETQ